MANRAKVTSVDALDTFRTQLIIYLSKARPAVEEISADVARLRSWVEYDQRTHWEKEMRRRLKKLEDAQQALFSAEISNLREAMMVEKMAVHKAKRAVDEADEKLRIIKKWNREFGHSVEPLAKQLEKLHTLLVTQTPKAVAFLGEAVKTLNDYANVKAPMAEGAPTESQPVVESPTDGSAAPTTTSEDNS